MAKVMKIRLSSYKPNGNYTKEKQRELIQLLEDIALSVSDPNYELLTFDLEQSLPTPVLTTIVFFSNTSCGHNLGLHDGKTSTACMA